MYYFKRRNDTNPIVPKDNDVTHEEVTQLLIKTTLKNHFLFFFNKSDKNRFKPCTFIQTNPSIDH